MRRVLRTARSTLPVLLLAALTACEPSGATLPAGFTDALVARVESPTALAFTPEGRLLVTTQPGRLRVHAGGTLLPTPALDLSGRTCSGSEQGLLGVAVDPAFSSNRFVYLFYTHRISSETCVNRVSRVVLPPGNVVDPASEVVLVDGMPSPAGNHNAGDLAFGKDGLLYITIGDGGCDYAGGGCAGGNDAARDAHALTGKVLRVTRDGAIPAGNPYQGPGTARCHVYGRTTPGLRCQETFASGLRNPFRLAFDPNAAGTRFFVNDVGQGRWEEIDEGIAGADYGWNVREGRCANGSATDCGPAPAGLTDPVHAYGRDTGCSSITGGAFVPNGAWPGEYDGDYLFADYVCGKIFRLESSGGSYVRREFASGLGGSSAVHLAFGPSGNGQALYYTTYADGGEVRRIDYAGGTNRPPTASATATPSSGPAPLGVTLDGGASGDPDGDALTYRWTFGDGSPAVETTTPTVTHSYASGVFTASLVVRDGRGALSQPATVQVRSGVAAPEAVIETPSTSTRFSVGQALTLRGRATGSTGQALPASALSWTVILHHDVHTHPFLGPVAGNDLTLNAPAPEDLLAAQSSYLELRLTATDPANGTSTTVVQDLQPRRVPVTFDTDPDGLAVGVNGSTVRGPTTVTSWAGYVLRVSARDQADGSGRPYRFTGWSDGGPPDHSVTTPASASSFTASFAPK